MTRTLLTRHMLRVRCSVCDTVYRCDSVRVLNPEIIIDRSVAASIIRRRREARCIINCSNSGNNNETSKAEKPFWRIEWWKNNNNGEKAELSKRERGRKKVRTYHRLEGMQIIDLPRWRPGALCYGSHQADELCHLLVRENIDATPNPTLQLIVLLFLSRLLRQNLVGSE